MFYWDVRAACSRGNKRKMSPVIIAPVLHPGKYVTGGAGGGAPRACDAATALCLSLVATACVAYLLFFVVVD